MNCTGCDLTGYRKLCHYDNNHDTCKPTQKPKQVSYKCIGTGYGSGTRNKNLCIKQNLPAGRGSYSSFQECQQNCGNPRYSSSSNVRAGVY